LTLTHNGKAVYEVPGSTSLVERIGLFFGDEVRNKLFPLESSAGPARLFGYIADPACERGNAKMQYLFVNGRWVRDRSLGHALQEAYRGLLMTGRYAVAFLFLEIPPDQVDVNVHPTKAEVRFRDGQALHSFVHAAIRNRLSDENLTARLRVTSTLGAPVVANGQPRDDGDWFGPPPQSTPAALFNGFPTVTRVQPAADNTPIPPRTDETPAPALPQPAMPAQPAPRLVKALQLYNAYLVQETPAGMLVIDQHALHERILFEQLKARLRQGRLESQPLLIPEPLDFTVEQAARTLDFKAELADLGLGIDDFGGGTLLLTSYPAFLGQKSPAELLKRVVDFLLVKDRVPTREQIFNDVLSLMACHAAVRVGDPLSQEEIAALLSQRELADDTHHCPHGRPTALLFSRHDLDRQFRRV
jgi:DNA mismatch repair protein MutL